MTKEQCALICGAGKTRVASAFEEKIDPASGLVQKKAKINGVANESNIRAINSNTAKVEIKAIKPATKQCSSSCRAKKNAKA